MNENPVKTILEAQVVADVFDGIVKAVDGSEQLTLEHTPAYPKGYCCTRCFEAETDVKRCQCRCRGQFHGIAHKRDVTLADKTPLDQTSQ